MEVYDMDHEYDTFVFHNTRVHISDTNGQSKNLSLKTPEKMMFIFIVAARLLDTVVYGVGLHRS